MLQSTRLRPCSSANNNMKNWTANRRKAAAKVAENKAYNSLHLPPCAGIERPFNANFDRRRACQRTAAQRDKREPRKAVEITGRHDVDVGGGAPERETEQMGEFDACAYWPHFPANFGCATISYHPLHTLARSRMTAKYLLTVEYLGSAFKFAK